MHKSNKSYISHIENGKQNIKYPFLSNCCCIGFLDRFKTL